MFFILNWIIERFKDIIVSIQLTSAESINDKKGEMNKIIFHHFGGLFTFKVLFILF